MDFSKIKEWLIPEGKVKSVSVGGKVLWQAKSEGDTVAVSGTWYFNETLSIPDSPIEQKVCFWLDYSGNAECDRILIKAVSNLDRYISIGKGGTLDAAIYSSNRWVEEAYRYIYFGNPQAVSKEFYEWLEDNAVQIEDPLYNTTWLLNNTFETKYYSDVKDNSSYSQVYGFPPALFICDGVAYEGCSSSGDYPNYYKKSDYKIYNIKAGYHIGGFGYWAITDDGMGELISASANGSWISQAYRTITSKRRITNVGGYLSYKLLMANATEIETPAPTEIEFTIDGKLYKGETNMTFYEWCNSSYNTIGCTTKDYRGSLIFLGTKRLYSETMNEHGVTSGVVVSAGEAYVFEEDRNHPDN